MFELLDKADMTNGYFNELQKATNLQPDKKSGYGSINPPKGLFEPDGQYYRHNVDPKGLRKKYYNLTFEVLRDIARKIAPISSIHTLRTMQVRPFSFKSYNDDETGFSVKLKDRKATPTKQQRIEMEKIEEFLLSSGFLDFNGSEDRDEGMQDINEQLVRELYTIDQAAISLRRNRKGNLLDYWILDGSTIVRTMPDVGYQGDKKIKFVQEVEGHIVETFTKDDLIFYYSNKRTDIRNKGYGYSYIEQCVDIITAWTFGMAYNKEFFNSSSQPKGILTFEGDQLDQSQIEELQRQWVSMFRGVKGLWKTPFLQYNAKWQSLAPSNRDMEFNQYIQILSSWIFAIHGTDAQEIGMKLNQSGSVLNDNQEAKIAFSKSRALRDLLTSISTIYNKILNQVPEWKDYTFCFTGLEARDQGAETDIDGKQVKAFMTLNEKRAEKDLPPLDNGDIVLDPQYIQYIQAKDAQQQAENEGQGDENGQDDDNQGNDENNAGDGDFEIDESDLEEVSKSLRDDYIEIVL